MPAETVYRVLDSTLDAVTELENLAWEIAQRAGFRDLSFAVHETAANTVIHGNRISPVATRVRDSTPGHCPIPSPLKNCCRESGRGIYLARALMDEHHDQSCDGGGTQITSIKYSHQQECVEDVRRRLNGRHTRLCASQRCKRVYSHCPAGRHVACSERHQRK